MEEINAENKRRFEQVIRDEFPKLIQMFNKTFDFKSWGFELTHTGIFPQYLPYIIYESRQCKLRFIWSKDRPYESPTIFLQYGRLHAPIDQNLMIWSGEECHCWHELVHMINFLDNLSPLEVAEKGYVVPDVMKKFRKLFESTASNEQEYLVQMNAYIWNDYGQRLFDLFDLRYPELWGKYKNFLKEYYLHRPHSPVKPPLYKVC